MKAVIAVVQGQDTGRVSQALRKNSIPFTTIDSTGGFLRMWGWGVATGASALEVCTSSCRVESSMVASTLPSRSRIIGMGTCFHSLPA